jgi:O-antigen/teichoic acid export membrane protein
VVIACVAIFWDDPRLSPLLWIVAASVVPAKLAAIYQVFALCDKAFWLQARIELIRCCFVTALVLAGVQKGGLVAVLGAPVLGSLLVIFLYRRHYSLGLRGVKLRYAEFLRQARIGLPITGLNVVSGNAGLQRWLERVLIQSSFGTASLGVYAFAAWVASQLLAMLGAVAQAIQPHLYDLLAQELTSDEARRRLVRPTWLMSVAAAVFLGAVASVLPNAIEAIVPEYKSCLPALQVLIAATFLSAVFWIPALILYSVRLNGQGSYFVFWTAAVAISIAIAAVALAYGGGVIWVAWGYLVSQGVVLVLTFRRVAQLLFPEKGDAIDFVKSLFLPIVNALLAVLATQAISMPLDVMPDEVWALLIMAAVKGALFCLLCLPTLYVIERRIGLMALFSRNRPAAAA